MTTCSECSNFIPFEDNEAGDCVQRVVDPRQAYYRAKPVESDNDSSKCKEFVKKKKQ